MSQLLAFLATGMLVTFVACCAASGMLQIVAWSRHVREGVQPSPRALLEPEAYFDAIGLRQIALSRRLLLLGGVAYLGFGALTLFSQVVA